MDINDNNTNNNDDGKKGKREDDDQIKRNAEKFLADLVEVEDDDNYDDIDDIRFKALKFCIKKGYASVSLIQRRFPVGFVQSHKIFSWMVNNNFVSCEQSDGKHKVFITQDEFAELISESNAEKQSSENITANQPDKPVEQTQYISQKIVIFGVGAAGCKIVNVLRNTQNVPADFYLVNDDPNELAEYHNINIIWVGAEPHDFHNFEYGKKAGIEFKKDIEHAIYRADLVIVVAGIGGGIGSGTSVAITEIARENKIHTIAIVSMPFCFEGKRVLSNAEIGLSELKAKANTTIVVPCDNVRKIKPSSVPETDAVEVVENTILAIFNTLIRPIFSSSSISSDFFETLSLLRESNNTYFGTGTSKGKDRDIAAIVSATSYPLANTKFEDINRAILFVEGGDDLTLDEVMTVACHVRTLVDDSTNIMLASNIDSKLTGKLKVSILATKKESVDKKESAEEESQETISSYCGTIPESENRSDELNKILEAAKDAALEYGSSYIGTEHLIYAMLDNECIAGKILKACNINTIKYAEYFERSIDKKISIEGFLPRAKHMIEQAQKFAEDIDGEGTVAGTEHLLLAILTSSDCLAMRILKAIDVNLENIASTLEKVLRTNDS